MKEYLRGLCKRMGKERFCRVIQNGLNLSVLIIFVILLLGVSGCSKNEVKVYEVRTSGAAYRTSENNNRVKELVENDIVYLIIEEGA